MVGYDGGCDCVGYYFVEYVDWFDDEFVVLFVVEYVEFWWVCWL